MKFKEAWQIAGMIFSMLDEEDPVDRQHEKMVDIILKYDKMAWDEHNQRWYDPKGKYLK